MTRAENSPDYGLQLMKNLALGALEKVIPAGYQINMSGQEYLEILNNHRGPLLVIANHTSADDPFLCVYPFLKWAPARLRTVLMPVSEEYVTGQSFPAYARAVRMARKFSGFTMPEIVQSYRYRTADPETARELGVLSADLGWKFVRKLKELLPYAPTVVIFPEGHRSDGRLWPAEKGAGLIARTITNSVHNDGYILSVSINFPRGSGKDLNYHPLKRPPVDICIDAPQSFLQFSSAASVWSGKDHPNFQTLSHYLMYRLTDLLPRNRWGFYAPEIIEQTLAGEFEQRQDMNGRVGVYDTINKRFVDLKTGGSFHTPGVT